MSFPVSTILDLSILALLAGTVFYALRLSAQLKLLKDSKSDLEQLVSNLSININRAHEAIQEMQDVAGTSGQDLQNLIRDAQDLSQELQIITESGNNMADRIEIAANSAPSSSRTVHAYGQHTQRDEFNDEKGEHETDQYPTQRPRRSPSPTQPHTKTRRAPVQPVEHFFIRDRDFDNANDSDDRYDNSEFDYEDEFKNLSSRAEKQLASALRRNRKFDA